MGGLEGPVGLKVEDDAGHRATGGGEGDDEAREAEQLQADPPARPWPYLLLRDVHLHREVDGEGPEAESAEDADDVVEEGHEHGDDGGEHHEGRPPHQPEQVELVRGASAWDPGLVLVGDQLALGPPLRAPLLHEGEQRLAEHLLHP